MTAENQYQSISVKPVGFVQSSEQEGKFCLKILPEYRAALTQLSQFSHVMVLWWANHHDNAASRSTLTADLPYAKGIQAGVFACRSEYRPNPIAVTVCPILAVDQAAGLVTLAYIDAFDGSPVLDLKPYVPVCDRVRDVHVAGWMSDWPAWYEDAEAYFSAHATDFGD